MREIEDRQTQVIIDKRSRYFNRNSNLSTN